MPRLHHALPRYRLHRASGQAVVTIGGRDHYLGPFGSDASHRARDRLIAQWLADGRQTPQAAEPAPPKTVNDLAAAYWRYATGYYRQDGEPTGELGLIKLALRRLCTVYGELAAESLSPLALRDLQERMIAEDLARSYINKLIARIRRMYKWGVAEFSIAVTAYQTLICVPGLKKGRTAARDTPPIRPVSDEVVQATLPHLPTVVADMIRLQRLLGCRPQDVCGLRPGDLETQGDVWWYVPQRHKTAYLGQERRIAVGPRAQAVLEPYLRRSADAYCFSPQESEAGRHLRQRQLRRSPVPPSQQARASLRPARPVGDRYDTRAYNRVIARACRRAGIAKWSPNQLRHAAGTETRRHYGLEAAQAVLGQKRLETTQIYAERRQDLAAEIMREIG